MTLLVFEILLSSRGLQAFNLFNHLILIIFPFLSFFSFFDQGHFSISTVLSYHIHIIKLPYCRLKNQLYSSPIQIKKISRKIVLHK
jgi:hypothetical protein